MVINETQYKELLKMIQSPDLTDIHLAVSYLEEHPLNLSTALATELCAALSCYTLDFLHEARPKAYDRWGRNLIDVSLSEELGEINKSIKIIEKFIDYTFKKSKLTPFGLASEIKKYIFNNKQRWQ